MLATWARDVYTYDERQALRRAIDAIASPMDYRGFASTGIYVFFDPETHDVLYIGLARDLAERFAQHNGLAGMASTGCKRVEITRWFEGHEHLGYGMFLQSPFSQVGVGRQRLTPTAEFYDEESGVFWSYPQEGLEEIKETEGLLIASYKMVHGSWPPWNKISGRVQTMNAPTLGTYALLELISGRADSLLLSRKTIRELDDMPDFLVREETLHVGRVAAITDRLGSGVDTATIISSLYSCATSPLYADSGLPENWNDLCEIDYFREPPPPPATAEAPGAMKPRAS